MYALVEEGSVKYIGSLPKCYGSVSGLDKADAATLCSFGWFTVDEVRPVLADNQVYDGHDTIIQSDKVTINYKTRSLTDVEIHEQKRAEITSKIDALESVITPRHIRAAILGDEFAIGRLRNIEEQIAQLRVNIISEK